MFAILFHVLITMIGAILIAGILAWLSWTLLGWTRFPGLGPIAAFAILTVIQHSGEFTQMLLMFSALLAVGAFGTLFVTEVDKARPRKSSTIAAGYKHWPHLFHKH
jgi:hypothetical protein